MAVTALAVLVPLVAATLLAAIRTHAGRGVAESIGLSATLAVGVLCAILLARGGDPVPGVHWLGGWTPDDGLPVGIALTPDALGAGMATFAATMTLVALIAAGRLLEARDPLFGVLMLVLLGAMVAFSLSGDLFTLFVFFELMSVCAYALVALRSDDRSALQGGIGFAVTNTLGGIALLLGIALLYGRTGALNLARMGEVLAERPPDTLVAVAFALVAGGFLVKAAAVPFHFWLADAYAAATTPVCLLFTAVLTELGLFGFARTYWTVFATAFEGHEDALRALFVGLGLLTALLGAVMSLQQRHLQRLLAFATVGSIGLFLVGVGLLESHGTGGAALWVIADGFAKAALFVAVGVLRARHGTLDAGELHGRGRTLPTTGVAFALAGLCVAGLPPFGPFVAKALVEHAAEVLPGYGWLPWALSIPSLLLGAAILRVAGGVFLGLGRPPQRDRSSDERDDAGGQQSAIALRILTVALVAAAATCGLVPGIDDAAVEAAARFIDAEGYRGAVLRGTSAAAAAAPASPSALAWVLGAATTAGAIALAAVLLGRPRRLPNPLAAALAGVRVLHTGHVGDYVLWLSAGLTALGTGLVLIVS